jgi:hypothetical protein
VESVDARVVPFPVSGTSLDNLFLP